MSSADGLVVEETPVLSPRFAAFLEQVTRVPHQHARWLQTLSLLEFTGALKIAAWAQSAVNADTPETGEVDRELMQHLAEESRHAYFFRRAAERTDPGAGTALCAPSALRYFHSLDASVRSTLRAAELQGSQLKRACYLTVTLLVEERAVGIYLEHDRLLARMGGSLRLQGILSEEEGHLAAMRHSLADVAPAAESAPALRARESALFNRLEERLVASVADD